jgi:DNA-binding NarL/FixJ family response regulator
MSSSAGEPIRVVIIDDETLFAKALGSWLARDPGLKVVGFAETGNRGWELCALTRPDLALVDVEMSDGDGITLAKRLRDQLPDTRVLIMTGRVDAHTAWQAGQVGVQGLIDKTIDPEMLGGVIRVLVQGGRFLSPSFQKIREEWLMQPEAFQKVLTNRELAVLQRLTGGQSDLDISKELTISVDTVACHRKSLRRKLGVHDDRSLVAYGREWGIFSPGG